MRVLMLVMSEVGHDARVQREATTLVEDGHEVVILCLAGANWNGRPDGVRIVPLTPSSVFPPRPRAPMGGLARIVRWWLLPTHRRSVQDRFCREASEVVERFGTFDAIHAHDLPTLQLAAELCARWHVPFVYDAHECWTGRPRRGRPEPLASRRMRLLERRWGSQASSVLTVSGGLATWFQRTYGWDHVTLVRNTFPEGSAPPRSDTPRGAVYAGRLGPGRDLETVARAARVLPQLEVVLVGPADQGWRDRADLSGVQTRPPVTTEAVDATYREMGLALVTLDDGCLNHRLALPNKLFQAVQAGVPVIAADLPELRRVVRTYGLGELYAPGNVASLVAAIDRVVRTHAGTVSQVIAARPELAWEVDSLRLRDVYRRL